MKNILNYVQYINNNYVKNNNFVFKCPSTLDMSQINYNERLLNKNILIVRFNVSAQ